jgi:hypothetical protein
MENKWIWDQWDFSKKINSLGCANKPYIPGDRAPNIHGCSYKQERLAWLHGYIQKRVLYNMCTCCLPLFQIFALVEHNAQNRFGGSGDMFLPRLCVCFCVCWVPGVGGRQRPGRGGQQSPALEGAKGRWECSGLGTSGWPFDWAWGGGDRLICLAVSWEPLGQVLGPPASPSQLWALSWSGPSQTVRAMDTKSKVWCPVELDARPSMKGSKSKSI